MDPTAWPPALIAAAVLALGGILLLAASLRTYRALRADRSILDAFELGGRLSLDPAEVRGTRLMRRRIEALQRSGALRQSPHGMLVPETATLAASLESARKRLRLLVVASGLCLVASVAIALHAPV